MSSDTIDDLVSALDRKEAYLKDSEGTRAASQHSRGKLSARERIALFLDPGSFTETDLFAEHRAVNFGMSRTPVPGEGVVTGFGTVAGRTVYLFSQDFSAMGGSLGEMHAQKINKIQELALRAGAPVVGIQDSGGARIQEGVDSLHGYGRIFMRNVRASGRVPQISVILGPCAGGAVYSPGLTDFVFMTGGISFMFITGPDVIRAVLATEVTAEELGGAALHNTKSGNAHFMHKSEEECFAAVRRLLSYLPSNNRELPPQAPSAEPGADPLALRTVVPADGKQAYDVRDAIRLTCDADSLLESQPLFAPNLVTAFVRYAGRVCGVIANQPLHKAGCLDIDASDKAARFIRFCDSFCIPLVTFVDTPGYLPGADQESGGIIRHGAKLIYAYCEATVPKITVTLRKSYGGASIAMCNKDLGADIVMAWPQAEIAVMGAAGAINVIFRKEIKAAADPAARAAELKKGYEEVTITPFEAAKRGYVDMVIRPEETRARITASLSSLCGSLDLRSRLPHGNIPL